MAGSPEPLQGKPRLGTLRLFACQQLGRASPARLPSTKSCCPPAAASSAVRRARQIPSALS
jgi:hypothetical protein